MNNQIIHPSEHIALEAEEKVFSMNELTQDLCDDMDKRMDKIQEKIDTKFLWRRKGDNNEKSTSG